jgi:hypothetical protein
MIHEWTVEDLREPSVDSLNSGIGASEEFYFALPMLHKT